MAGTSQMIKTHPQKKSILSKPIPFDPETYQSVLPGLNYLEVYAKSNNSKADKDYNGGFYDPDSFGVKKFEIPAGLLGNDQTPDCFSGFIKGECKNGHRFAKAILCGKEYCPSCGENWSWVHQRRYYRWLPKLRTFNKVGYLVITLPMEIRAFFLDKHKLNEFRRYVIRLMKRNGYDRGLCRWHWCGEDGATWHPHLNLLFKEVWIEKEILVKLRELITAKLEMMTGRLISALVINYSYSRNRLKHKHWLRYVTRATFRKFHEDIYKVIKGYRNNVVWGKWTKEEQQNDVSKLEKGKCPICDTKIKWDEWSPEIDPEEWLKNCAGGNFVKALKIGYPIFSPLNTQKLATPNGVVACNFCSSYITA